MPDLHATIILILAITQIMNKEKILIILERDSYEKDAVFMNHLVASLHDTGYRPIWYNPHGVGSSQRLTSHPFINQLPVWLRFPIKAFGLLAHPKQLRHYITLTAWKESTISGRVSNLKQFIHRIRSASTVPTIAILGRSAGGRIASLVADELGIEKIICLGYPFKHPDHAVEPERYEHLRNLKTPFLIIQGATDTYGGRKEMHQYSLSPAISLEFIETDHDFILSPDQTRHVENRIKDFLISYKLH